MQLLHVVRMYVLLIPSCYPFSKLFSRSIKIGALACSSYFCRRLAACGPEQKRFLIGRKRRSPLHLTAAAAAETSARAARRHLFFRECLLLLPGFAPLSEEFQLSVRQHVFFNMAAPGEPEYTEFGIKIHKLRFTLKGKRFFIQHSCSS